MKIDWTKPIRVAGMEAHYVGRTPRPDCPNVVAVWLSGLPDCLLYQVNDFGRDTDGLPRVINAPEPKRVYSGLWTSVWIGADGRIYTTYLPHTSREDALAQTSTDRRIACIRLPDFTEGEGLE